MLKVMQKTSRNHYRRNDAQKLMDLANEFIGIHDTGGIYAFRIRQNVERLVSEKKQIKGIEEEILKLTESDGNVKRIDDMKGIGPVNAAAMVSEIPDIDHFDSALKLQSYGGKASRMSGSGGKDHATKISRIRNSYLANSVYESARSLVLHKNEEFLLIYEREIKKGKRKKQVYIIVARRLLYHIYSMMKNKKPYRVRLPNTKDGEGSTPTAG